MNWGNNETCSHEVVEPSSGFVMVLSLLLIILMGVTFLVLTTLFCIKKKSSALVSSRANVLTFAYVFGSVIQIIPRALTAVQIYFKLLMNRQLAKFELISAMNMRGYNKLDPEAAEALAIGGEEASKSNPCWKWICQNFESCFRNRRKEQALQETELILRKMPGASKNRHTEAIAQKHFPAQYILFLASERFAVLTQVFVIIVVLITFRLRTASEALCLSPCELELELVPDVFVMTIIVLPITCFYMYKIRNEPDPLGLVREIPATFVVGLVFALGLVIPLLVDPNEIEERGQFRWMLLWVFGSWIEIVICLGYPLYLAKNQEIYRKEHFNDVSLSKVLESDAGRDQFKAFLIGELSVENYLLWYSANKYRENFMERSGEENRLLRKLIVNLYVNDDAQFAVNVSSNSRDAVKNSLDDDPKPSDFDDAIEDVLQNMEADSFTRFRRTSEFSRLFRD